MMKAAAENSNLRSRRAGGGPTCCPTTTADEDYSDSGSHSTHHADIEACLSFEDFSERLIEDEEDDKKSRRQQRKSAVGCALTFVCVCGLLFFAASKTLSGADMSVSKRRTNLPPVQRYQSIHQQTTRRF